MEASAVQPNEMFALLSSRLDSFDKALESRCFAKELVFNCSTFSPCLPSGDKRNLCRTRSIKERISMFREGRNTLPRELTQLHVAM